MQFNNTSEAIDAIDRDLMTPTPPRRRLHPKTTANKTVSDPRREALPQDAINTMSSMQQRDEWDCFGEYVATNARSWEPDIAGQFKLEMMALVLKHATNDRANKRALDVILEEYVVE